MRKGWYCIRMWTVLAISWISPRSRVVQGILGGGVPPTGEHVAIYRPVIFLPKFPRNHGHLPMSEGWVERNRTTSKSLQEAKAQLARSRPVLHRVGCKLSQEALADGVRGGESLSFFTGRSLVVLERAGFVIARR